TDIAGLLSFLSQVLKRKTIIFLISDFITPPFERQLAVLSKRHELTAIQVHDPADLELPSCGLVRLEDPETGTIRLIDAAKSEIRRAYRERAEQLHTELRTVLNRHGAGHLLLRTDQPFIHELRRFFAAKQRVAR
ncbi:MAG: hypothetical protein KDD69_18565, partial [Bdellovibrionales bacterium]|nr:hypothetical protein [Bdellovibrionales bacterium]